MYKNNIERSKRVVKKSYKKMNSKINYLLLIIALILIVSISGFTKVTSGSTEKKTIYYKSIEVVEGDTLWSIAEEYSKTLDVSLKDYITELKKMNSLDSDTIRKGYFIVVYYSN